jgi:RHS repeat-associated protein
VDPLSARPSYATFGGAATQVVHNYYDLENRWIAETVDSDGDGDVDHTTGFAYDGDQITLQFDKAGDGPLSAADLSHRYLWQANAVDQLMADEAVSDTDVPGDVLLALTDHLGTVRDLAAVDAQTGATSVVNHLTYDSYGQLLSQTDSTVDCLFGFTGRPVSVATGLQNNLNRWYDPVTQRWASEDPIGVTGGQTNVCVYCGNAPNNSFDPSGLATPKGKQRIHESWLDDVIEFVHEHGGNRIPAVWIEMSVNLVGSQWHEIGGSNVRKGTVSSPEELLAFFRQIDAGNAKIATLVIKGHGYEEGVVDNQGKDMFIVRDGRVYLAGVDVTNLLRRITNEYTTIDLRACNADPAADELAKILGNGATVTGIPTKGINVPGTPSTIAPLWRSHSYPKEQ